MKLFFAVKVILLLLIGLIVVQIIDPLDKSTISTPFLLGIILVALSLRQSVALVATTSTMYTVMTVYALETGREYADGHFLLHPHPYPYFWLFQRGGVFLLLCTLSIYLARYRTDSQRLLKHVQDILAKLPAPVVISDAAGYIIYANEALFNSFGQNATALIGKRYVDLFMKDIQEGKAMRYYIELFAEDANKVHEMEMTPFHAEKRVPARLTCLGMGSNRVMITVLAGDMVCTS